METDTALCRRVEAFRLKAGVLMGLGDVAATTVPKVCLVAPPGAGGSLATRMFIPHRVHTSIGVLAAVTVATAAVIEGSAAAQVYRVDHGTSCDWSTPLAGSTRWSTSTTSPSGIHIGPLGDREHRPAPARRDRPPPTRDRVQRFRSQARER